MHIRTGVFREREFCNMSYHTIGHFLFRDIFYYKMLTAHDDGRRPGCAYHVDAVATLALQKRKEK